MCSSPQACMQQKVKGKYDFGISHAEACGTILLICAKLTLYQAR